MVVSGGGSRLPPSRGTGQTEDPPDTVVRRKGMRGIQCGWWMSQGNSSGPMESSQTNLLRSSNVR